MSALGEGIKAALDNTRSSLHYSAPEMQDFHWQTLCRDLENLVSTDSGPSTDAFNKEEGDALIWLIDFVMGNPRDVLRGSKWPPLLASAKAKLKEAGCANPYPGPEDS